MPKIAIVLQILALISLSAFSGALLFIALVLVKFWQAIEPPVFLSWMGEHFFRFPTIMVPLNIIALVLVIAALITSWNSSASRLPWGLGLACLVICTVTFPIYFLGANAAFVTGSLPLVDVTTEINTWSNWHWSRTGLTILAVVFAALGLYQQLDRTNQTSEVIRASK